MDPKIAKRTQDSLGKIIKKPPLTEKLLSKPPFRFLHDIMTSVIKTTGFMKGLFTDGEMNSENVKDKETKLAFLQKGLDMVCLVTGKALSVKLAKVIAGHEPEKTNEFLQALAHAINKKVDNDDYVKKVLNKGKENENIRDRSKSGDRRKREEKQEINKDKEEQAEREERHHKDERRDRERSREGRNRDDKHRNKDDRHKDRVRDEGRDHRSPKKNVLDTSEDLSNMHDLDDFEPGTENQSTPKTYAQVVSNSPDQKENDPKEVQNQKRVEQPGPAMPQKNLEKQSVRKSAFAATKIEKSPATNRSDKFQNKQMSPVSPKTPANRLQKTSTPRSSDLKNPALKSRIVPAAEDPQTPKSSKMIDKKRKLGTKSRLSVRTNETSVEKENKSNMSRTKTEKVASERSRPQNLVNKDTSQGRVRKTVALNASANPQRRSMQCSEKAKAESKSKPEDKHRTSSFTILGVLGDDSRDEGKENESPEMVNGESEHRHREEDVPPAARIPRPASAKGHRRRREEDEPVLQRTTIHRESEPLGEDDLPPQVAEARKLARPSSARPAPPKRKQEGMENEPAMKLGSGKPTNLIVDDDKSSDEDEHFLVEESAPPPSEIDQSSVRQGAEEEGDHGGLVKKILETKKELESGSQQWQTHTKTQIERPHISDAQKRKQREHVQREIDKLRASIQTLTRSANPLGKIMDYVQEDLDSMQKEQEKWKAENKEHTLALKRETSITDQAVEPMKAQLAEIDQAIKDQLDLIAAVKSNIIKNDQKIDKMLRSIARS